MAKNIDSRYIFINDLFKNFQSYPKNVFGLLSIPNTTVGYVDFKPLRKESSLSISKQFMKEKSSNVQSVNIRLLGKVTL